MKTTVSNIALDSFKGVTREQSFGSRNLITGPNGSGKTAWLYGLQWAIQGDTPLGGTDQATARIAGPKGCGVDVELSGDQTVSRALDIYPDTGKTKTTTLIGGLTGKEADAAIKTACGDFAPMFDLRVFTSLSGDRRKTFIMGLCRGADADPAALEHRIAYETLSTLIGEGTVEGFVAGKYEKGFAALDAKARAVCLNTLADKLGEADKAAFLAAVPAVREACRSGPEAVTTCIETMTARVNALRRTRDEAVAAGRRLADRRAEVRVVSATLDALEAESGRLAGLVGDTREAVGSATAAAAGIRAERERLDGLIAEATLAGDTANEHEHDLAGPWPVDGLRAKAEAARRESETLGVGDEAALLAARDAGDAVEADVLRRFREADADNSRVANESERAVEAYKTAVEGDWARLAVAVATLERLPEFVAAGGADWRELRAIVAANSKPDEIREKRAAAEQAVRNAQASASRLLVASNAYNDAKAKADAARGALADFRNRQGANIAARNDLLAQAKGFDDAANAMALRREAVVAELGRLRAIIIQNLADRVKVEKRLAALTSTAGGADLSELTSRLQSLVEEQARVAADIAAKRQYAAVEGELRAAQEAAERSRAEHDVCKAFVGAAKAARDTMLATLIAPIRDRVNLFLDAAGMDWIADFKLESPTGKPDFDMGAIVSGETRVPFDALSDGERAMFGAALAYAMVVAAGVPLPLLLLDAGALDLRRLDQLLQACTWASKDCQVFVCTHLGFIETVPAGWNTVDMGATA